MAAQQLNNTAGNGLPPRPPRRAHRRLFQGLLFLFACGVVMLVGVYSPLFTLQRVVVHGNKYLQVEDVEQIARVYKGQPIFQLKTDAVTQQLLQDLRIESAVVRRELPDTLDISIEERQPIATIATNYGYADLDRQGLVLASYKNLRQMPLPLITGVKIQDRFVGDANTDENVQSILAFLQQLDTNALNQISEVNAADMSAVTLYTTSAVQIRLGSLERWEEKAQLTQDFLDALPQSKHAIEYVDFRFRAPYIKLNEVYKDKAKQS